MAANPQNPQNPQNGQNQNQNGQNQNQNGQNQNQNGQNQNQNGQNQNQNGQNQQPASGSNSASSSTSAIPQSAPAGGLLFTQPAATAAPSFYKIAPSQPITIGWNMTSVISTPQHLTLSAFCADNGNTYPVGPTNGIIPGNSNSVVWDPFAYQQANPGTPLIVGSYTLSVWDDRGPTALPAPGLLAPNNQLRFALYTTQAYTPLASWTCQGCNAASPNSVARGFPVALIATCVVLLFSGMGILRTALGVRVRNEED